jgi:type IV pilus assembly protein PilC
MSHATTAKSAPNPLLDALRSLHKVKIGGVSSNPAKTKIKRKELAYILANLSTLLENGVSLSRALETLAREASLKKYAFILETMRRKLEAGESFSAAAATCPNIFSELMLNQIRVGERSGAIRDAFARITQQLEQGSELRGKILKRLSYPLVVLAAGSGVVTFMLLCIVPTFEETYSKAHIPLPASTRALIAVGDFAMNYGWLVLIGTGGLIFGYTRLRKIPHLARRIDRIVLKIPGIGPWVRDIAVLQFIEVLGTMMESGFKVVDALSVSVGSVGNLAVRQSVEQLRLAVVRGERLSREIDKHGDIFPPIVSQLVIVGEQTGNLGKSTQHVREHLRKDIERRAEMCIGAIEPFLTLGMALAVGGILLAIYLPMFGMVDAVRAG